jgi:quinol monooxygenase YgiN
MADLALFITVRTQPGKRDALKALWEEHLKPRAAANASQSRYVFSYDLHDADVIRLAEVYETETAFQENASGPWFAAYMKAAAPLLAGEPEVHMAAPQWVK